MLRSPPWEDVPASAVFQACGGQKGDGHGRGSVKNDGGFYFNKMFLIPPLYRHICMSWVDRWWKEQLSLFFAQLLWKLFASWVPFSSCSMGHQDVYSNRG